MTPTNSIFIKRKGSTMFVMEDERKRILYTGDVRAEDWFTKNLTAMPCLNDGYNLRNIDRLYFDSTFYDIRYFKFPLKRESCERLVQTVKSLPKSARFLVKRPCLGFEDILVALGSFFKCKVHVSKYWMDLFRGAFADFEDSLYESEILQHITIDSGCRFHSCDFCNECKEQESQGNLYYIYPSALGWADYLNECRQSGEALKPVQMSGRHIKLLFAMHSSHEELLLLIRSLKPKAVHFCVPTMQKTILTDIVPISQEGMANGPEGIYIEENNTTEADSTALDLLRAFGSSAAPESIEMSYRAEAMSLVHNAPSLEPPLDGAENMISLSTEEIDLIDSHGGAASLDAISSFREQWASGHFPSLYHT
ncbi:hypothetical protein BC829DRAFT_23232 [Chytridium lagenaria]|nr:hypothetical protein BC829DRAFT_23232 [Chytridium lagenaria]